MTRAPIRSNKTQSPPTESEQSKQTTPTRNNGVNYIKNNIANLSNQVPRPRNPNLPTSSIPYKAGKSSRLENWAVDVNTSYSDSNSKNVQSGDASQDPDNNIATKSENTPPAIDEEPPTSAKEKNSQSSVDTTPVTAYNKPAVNSAPVTQQHVAARAK